VHELRALGVPTIALLHGLTYARGYRELRPASDYVQLWSEWDAKWMRRYGVASERLQPRERAFPRRWRRWWGWWAAWPLSSKLSMMAS
jgi:hypothetical protein